MLLACLHLVAHLVGNQSDLRHAEAILQSESHDKDRTIENNNTSPEKVQASHVTHIKQICKLAELPIYNVARERQILSLHVATHVATPANHGGQHEHRMDNSRMNCARSGLQRIATDSRHRISPPAYPIHRCPPTSVSRSKSPFLSIEDHQYVLLSAGFAGTFGS
jgi:hypothetical protein